MAKKDAQTKDIQIFCYKAMPVRTTEIDGETWFVAKDVCDILEHSNSRMAVEELDDDEKGVSKVYTPGGMQDMTIVSEAGLYTLLMRSNKPEAKPFRRWVTHEVLPSIRKTGSYTAPKKPEKKSRMSVAWVKAVSKIIDLAFNAKSDEEFQKILALDLAFKQENGYSALNAAGLYIDTACQCTKYHKKDWYGMDYEFHYQLRLDEALVLPKSYSAGYFEGDENNVQIYD